MDYTHSILHAVYSYTLNGEYCGDWELNPETAMQAMQTLDFTDVIQHWD